MKSISPKAHFRQLVIRFSEKRGVTAASIRYQVCRKAIYEWKKWYDGKVERQHRLDEQRFYSTMRMISLEDGRKQLAKYNKISNNISKSCLKYRSPNAVLADYLAVM